MAFNIVELATADSEDCAFDQPCRFGHRIEGHAVYCHNDNWDDSPRKCHRSWYTHGKIKDEDCAGFEPNPGFRGPFDPTPPVLPVCEQCRGAKRIATDRGKTETCPLCVGSGTQPSPIDLTSYEQNTLEMGTTHSGRHDTAGHSFVRIMKDDSDFESLEKLARLDLIVIRSISPCPGNGMAYLLENTMKGEAVMRANWKAREPL